MIFQVAINESILNSVISSEHYFQSCKTRLGSSKNIHGLQLYLVFVKANFDERLHPHFIV